MGRSVKAVRADASDRWWRDVGGEYSGGWRYIGNENATAEHADYWDVFTWSDSSSDGGSCHDSCATWEGSEDFSDEFQIGVQDPLAAADRIGAVSDNESSDNEMAVEACSGMRLGTGRDG